MHLTPFETMQSFHKSAPDRKQVYKKMQKTYLAQKVPMGLFTDSSAVIESDKKSLQIWSMRGFLDGGDIREWHDEERNNHMKARNLHFGTRLFGTWRNTACVYKINEDVAPQALASLIPDDTPSDIYTKIPEWCVYMEIPKSHNIEMSVVTRLDENNKDTFKNNELKVLGFWAMHDRVQHEGKDRLCLDIFFHVDQSKDTNYRDIVVTPTRLLLSNDLTVAESFEISYNMKFDAAEESPVRTALSMLLWLCVEEPDVTNVHGVKMSREDLKKPRYARNKQTGSFVPPMQATYLEIAQRMGGEIKSWNQEIVESEKSGQTAKRKAPHIRRGHWHGMWVGSGDNKEFKLRWQKPLFINAQ